MKAALSIVLALATSASAGAVSTSGLRRVATDPAGPSAAVAVHGGTVLWSEGRRLMTGRLGVDGSIEPAGSIVLNGFVEHLVCLDDAAVVAAGPVLFFLDLSRLDRPRVARREPVLPSGMRFTDLVGARGVVYASSYRGVETWDVSRPDAPRRSSGWARGSVEDLSLGEAGLGLASSRGFVLLDVSDPSHPTERSSLPSDEGPRSVAVGSSLAVVVFPWATEVVSLSDPASPRVVGRTESLGADGDTVLVDDRAAYSATPVLAFLDLEVPGTPSWIRYESLEREVRDLASANHHLVVALGDAVASLAVTPGLEPIQLDHLSNPSPSWVRRRWLGPTGVVMAARDAALVSMAPSATGFLAELGTVELPFSPATDLSQHGGVGVVGGSGGSTAVFTLEGDGSLAVAAWAGTFMSSPHLVQNGVAWGRRGFTEIVAVDLSIPEAPSLLGSVELAPPAECRSAHSPPTSAYGTTTNLALAGSLVAAQVGWFCDPDLWWYPSSWRLHIVDGRLPGRPVEVASIDLDAKILEMVAAGDDLVLLAAGRDTELLLRLDLSSPSAPTIAASSGCPPGLSDLRPFGSRIVARARHFLRTTVVAIDPESLTVTAAPVDVSDCSEWSFLAATHPYLVLSCEDGFGELYRWFEAVDRPTADR